MTTEVTTDAPPVAQAVVDDRASAKLPAEVIAVEVAFGATERLAVGDVAFKAAEELSGVLDAETRTVEVRFTVSVTVERLVDVAAVDYKVMKRENVHVISEKHPCLPDCWQTSEWQRLTPRPVRAKDRK